MGLPYNTLYTSTYFHQLTIRRQSDGNLRQFAVLCYILPSPLNPTKFCQDYHPNPILPCVYIDQTTKLIIYTLSPYFLTFFLYAISWLYYIVYVYSLIISTLLYIIATCTYSAILYYVNLIHHTLKYRMTLKPLCRPLILYPYFKKN